MSPVGKPVDSRVGHRPPGRPVTVPAGTRPRIHAVQQVARDHPLHYLQYRCDQFGPRGHPQPANVAHIVDLMLEETNAVALISESEPELIGLEAARAKLLPIKD